MSGVIVLVVGEVITRPLLALVSTPENAMDMAVLYLRIYFSGSIFIMLYNFEAQYFGQAAIQNGRYIFW